MVPPGCLLLSLLSAGVCPSRPMGTAPLPRAVPGGLLFLWDVVVSLACRQERPTG